MKKVKLLVFLVLSLCFSIFIASAEEANAADMHRLYNPNSGEHFYTANTNEKNHLVKVGWKSEGIGWIAPANGSAVYRLYNPNAGDHHYTLHAYEKNHLVKVGWKYEGIGWYSDTKKAVPLYRAYNPNAKAGSHNYTVNYAEQKNLLRVGWRDEGIAWYGIRKTTTPVTKYTVTVKHVGLDGKILKTSTASVEKGKSYTAKAGSFSGYTLKGSNSQTVTVNGNKTITFNYTKNVAPVTKYTVTVKHVGSDGKELKKTTATIEKGKNYTAKAETFSGYTLKGSNSQTVTVNGNKTITFNYTKNATPAPKYTITVKHLEESTGKEIAKTTTVSVDKGHTYTADAAVVTGYTHIGDFSQTVVVDGNKTITFKYKLIEYAVRVKHEDIDGNLLEVDNYVFVKYGHSYTAKAKSIDDYTLADEPTKTVTIKGATFITFKYTKNSEYKITVKYIDKTSGQEIMKSTTENIGKGKHFSVIAPQIDGYTVLPEDEVKSINSVSKDETVTIKYKKNPAVFKIIVKYKDSATEKEIKTETAHYIEEGKSFSITAPELLDYTVVPSDKIKSITSVSKNETLTIKYTKNAVPVTKYKITVNYVAEAGKVIKQATTTEIESGKSFSMPAPKITGYTVNDEDKTKNIASVTKNETVTFNYTINKYPVTIYHKSDDGVILETETVMVEHGKHCTVQSKKYDNYYSEDSSQTALYVYDGSRTLTFEYKKIADLPASELKIMQDTILQKLNELRVSKGLNPLQTDSKLMAAAQKRAEELKVVNTHDRPDGSEFYTVLGEFEVPYRYAGENIASKTSSETSGKVLGEALYTQWFNSDGHRENMLREGFNYAGIGVSSKGRTVYGVQLFINR